MTTMKLDLVTTVNLIPFSYKSCHDTSISHTGAAITVHYQKEIGAKVHCIFGGRVISFYHGYYCQYVVWVCLLLCFYMYVMCVCIEGYEVLTLHQQL